MKIRERGWRRCWHGMENSNQTRFYNIYNSLCYTFVHVLNIFLLNIFLLSQLDLTTIYIDYDTCLMWFDPLVLNNERLFKSGSSIPIFDDISISCNCLSLNSSISFINSHDDWICISYLSMYYLLWCYVNHCHALFMFIMAQKHESNLFMDYQFMCLYAPIQGKGSYVDFLVIYCLFFCWLYLSIHALTLSFFQTKTHTQTLNYF